jgi:predicted RNA-binding protein with PUA-like domain
VDAGERAGWLFKEEPDHYSFADLEHDGEALWDGVANALALKYLRQVRQGDRILYYHTGKEKAIVGEMRALSDAMADPKSEDPKAVVVKVQATRRMHKPLTLKEIKQDATFADWELVRMSRLSVMPVSKQHWRRVEELCGQVK